MRRLGATTLGEANSGVRRPAYDWRRVGIGIAHLGLGAFHRCHQAEYTDDMLEARGGDWGIVGVNLRPPLLADTLGAQDGLYARRLRDDSGVDECRIIGCIRADDRRAGRFGARDRRFGEPAHQSRRR